MNKSSDEMSVPVEKSRSPAIGRMARILDLLADSQSPLSGADIARELGLPRSSVHVLLAELEKEGLVRKSDERRYAMGMRVVPWAAGYLAQQDIVGAFLQCLQDMPQFDRYTLTLSTLDGDKVVYLACKNSSSPLGVTFRIGMRMPAVLTATGKCLLSTLDEAQLCQRIVQFPPPPTEKSVQDMESLQMELAQVRQQGYAVDNGQLRRGMYCLGVGIFSADGQARYGIAVSLVEAEADEQTVQKLIAGMQQLAAKLQPTLL